MGRSASLTQLAARHMGNCEACISMEIPLTTERLADAVQRNDTDEVEHLLRRGVCVNNPIDNGGHTVLDMLLVNHAADVNMTQEPNGMESRLHGEKVTNAFDDQHCRLSGMLKVLRHHGAMVSYSIPNARSV